MTKEQASAYLRAHEDHKAIHPNNGYELVITPNRYSYDGVTIWRRLSAVTIDSWLDDCFFGNPKEGWEVKPI